MRKGQIAVVTIFAILLTSSLTGFNAHEATANPIAIGYEHTYGYLILDNNMSMPEALVNITIEPSQGEGTTVSYNITIKAVYTFLSPNDQLATIGLACPNTWFNSSYEAQIFQNESVLPNILLHYNELVSENDTYPSNWEYLDFITFNCTLEAGKTTDILVLLDLGSRAFENAFWFDYFVATARSWNGTTHEMIIMNMKNPTILEGCSFTPNASLTVSDNPPWRTATWDLNMDVFEDDFVGFRATHKQSVWPEITQEDLTLGAVIVTVSIGIVVLIVIVLKRGR